jgi:hypothetical protein
MFPHADNPCEGTHGPTGFYKIFLIMITRMRGHTDQQDFIKYSSYGLPV